VSATPHAEVLFAAAYAAGLVLLAGALEGVARYTVWQAHRYHAAGFRYHRRLDAWICPEGEQLRRIAADPMERVARYRAAPHICNACPRKSGCTDSDKGREVQYDLRPWLGTAIGQFQRGMSLVILGLAALICAIEIVRYPGAADTVPLGTVLLAVTLLAWRGYTLARRVGSQVVSGQSYSGNSE
jgi:hypothetical protein